MDTTAINFKQLEDILMEAVTTQVKNPEAVFFYRDTDGIPLYAKVRYLSPNGNKAFISVHVDDDGNHQKREPVFEGAKPLYGLDLLAKHPDSTAWIVEGEKCADYLNRFFKEQNYLDIAIAITSGGSGTAAKASWEPLQGRHVIIWPDKDEPGKRYGNTVAKLLKERAIQIEMVEVELLDLPKGGDCVDFLDTHPGISYENLFEQLAIKEVQLKPENVQVDKPKADKSDTAKLIRLVREQCQLFTDGSGVAYASIAVDSHTEHWPLESSGFGEWVSAAYFDAEESVPSDSSISSALRTLAGFARKEEQASTYLRIAKHEGQYFIDLCNDKWQAVKVDANGWEVMDKLPVKFIRNKGMRPLPLPEMDGALDKLWEITNIPEDGRAFCLAWMIECFRPDTSFPILELTGLQGSAKSATQNYLREFIDPSDVNNRTLPETTKDLFVSAQNNHLLSFNNTSFVNRAFQDAFCVISTGGGYAARSLYSNADETLINVQRPTVINGINNLITQQDAVDRTIGLKLDEVDHRLTEKHLKGLFAEHRGKIFGAILGLFVSALKLVPSVEEEANKGELTLLRLADFCILGEAVFRSLGYKPGDFLKKYEEIRQDTAENALSDDPVGAAIIAYVEEAGGVLIDEALTAAAWSERLRAPKYNKDSTWPKSGKGVANALRRQMPALKLIGIEVTPLEQRSSKGKLFRIKANGK